jgi:hypothetical protein
MQEKQNYEVAYLDYQKGMKYKDIAEKYNVSINTVKSWKSRYWNNKSVQPKVKKVATKNKKGCTQKNKVGAPIGNNNAVGNGAPIGNKNAISHGIYANLMYEHLSEDELEFMQNLDFNDIEELKKEVKWCDMRIIYLNKLLSQEHSKVGGLSILGVTKRKIKYPKSESSEILTETIATIEVIIKIMAEINKFQKQKTKCLDLLIKFGYTNKKLDKELELMQIKIDASKKDLTEEGGRITIVNDLDE